MWKETHAFIIADNYEANEACNAVLNVITRMTNGHFFLFYGKRTPQNIKV